MFRTKRVSKLSLICGIENAEGITAMIDGLAGNIPEDVTDSIDEGDSDDLDTEDTDDDVESDEEDSDDIDDEDDDSSDDTSDSDDSDDDTGSDESGDDGSENYLKQLLAKLTDKAAGETTEEQADEESEIDIASVYAGDSFKKLTEALELEPEESGHLQSFMNDLLEQNTKLVIKEIMDQMPKVVKSSLSETRSKEKAREDFYNNNQALVGKEELVTFLAQKNAEKGTYKNVDDLLKDTAAQAYKLLNIKPGDVSKSGKRKGRSPALPKSKVSRKQTKKSRGVSAEIDEMLNIMQ